MTLICTRCHVTKNVLDLCHQCGHGSLVCSNCVRLEADIERLRNERDALLSCLLAKQDCRNCPALECSDNMNRRDRETGEDNL